MATEYETDVLAELVARKRDGLLRLREMGRVQYGLIEADEMAGLLELLCAKQRVLSELQELERRLDPFRGQAPHERRWRSAEARRHCAAAIDESEALLAEIIGQERLCEEALRRRRDEAAQRLQIAHLADEARGAYTAGPAEPMHQLDLLSES